MKTNTIILLLVYTLLIMYLAIIMWIAPFQLSITLHLFAIIILCIIAISNYILRRIAVMLFCFSIAIAVTVSLVKNIFF